MRDVPFVEPGEVAVAVAIDDAYVPHFATCVASIAASRGREAIRFFVLQGPTLSERSVRALRDFVHGTGMALETIPITDDLAGSMPQTRAYPSIIWHRLLIPQLLPDLDRVLVLDADLIVLQSLWPLYRRDMGSDLLAAVGTSATFAHGSVDRVRALGLEPEGRYLNTGVMLMNLDAMRADALGSRAIRFGHERLADLTFPEQDALNVLAKGRWGLLHPRWNAMSHHWLKADRDEPTYSGLENESARLSPAIVHFEGLPTVKPWNYRSRHPMRFLYRDLRATTPWPLARLDGKNWISAVLRRLPLRAQYAIAREKRRVAQLRRNQP